MRRRTIAPLTQKQWRSEYKELLQDRKGKASKLSFINKELEKARAERKRGYTKSSPFSKAGFARNSKNKIAVLQSYQKDLSC